MGVGKNRMPPVVAPVIALTLGALGAAALTRALVREWRRVNAELDAVSRDTVERDRRPTLRRDPHSGTYRPERSRADSTR
jgi:hypothetical protein